MESTYSSPAHHVHRAGPAVNLTLPGTAQRNNVPLMVLPDWPAFHCLMAAASPIRCNSRMSRGTSTAYLFLPGPTGHPHRSPQATAAQLSALPP
jgi:hypothetical protein